jgi:hypothetical protein
LKGTGSVKQIFNAAFSFCWFRQKYVS